MPQQIAINQGNRDELSRAGFSARSLTTIERALRRGMRFRDRDDLAMLGIPVAELEATLPVLDFRPPVQPPAMRILRITVGPTPLFGYRVQVDSGTFRRLVTLSASGQGLFAYSRESLEDKVRFTVLAPSGERVDIDAQGGNTVPYIEVDRDRLADLNLTIRKPGEISQAKPGGGALGRITGRLISTTGRRPLEGISITFFAATKLNPQPGDFVPVASAATETTGYFSTGQLTFADPQDAQKLTAAKAVIGLSPVTAQVVALVPAANGLGELPAKVLLFVDDSNAAAEPGKSDCGCGTLDFHQRKPLEEFNFYSVVRTTEPIIEAYTIQPVDEVSLDDLFPPDKRPPGFKPGLTIRRDALAEALSRFGKLDDKSLAFAFDMDRIRRTRDILAQPTSAPAGRVLLDGVNSIDWDDKPTIYQSTTISHGHILNFKQEWLADGYSIGDLLYSLPLAPGQQKQIVVFDWDRRESASNTQQLDYQESLYNSLARDRDVNEVARSMVKERIEAESESETSAIGWGAGLGALGVIPAQVPIPVGGLVGVAGGSGSGSSSASQSGSRTATGSTSQSIQDKTVQAANGVRSQRSTVIQTVSQGERFEVSAESVANYNHCHALTIQYFEVLRHFQVQTRLTDVQECLFVPLRMTPFDRKKTLRWRGALSRYLKKRGLLRGFDSLERVDEEQTGTGQYYDSIGFPSGAFASQPLLQIDGELFAEFHLTRPPNDDADAFAAANWMHLASIVGTPQEFYELNIKSAAKKDEAFFKAAGPRIAETILNAMEVVAISNASAQEIPLPVDLTLLSPFQNRTPLNVSIRMNDIPNVRRDSIDRIVFRIKSGQSGSVLTQLLTKTLKVIVRSATIRYRTAHLAETLFQDVRINNDLTLDGDSVMVATPLKQSELRQPRLEDVELSNALLRHLNENVEYYHQCIWWQMDAQRRFMLLDGIVAPGRANGRSVASVVENRLIGVAGNSLILPVAPGFHLDPNLKEDVDLLAHYYEDPRDPARLSLPTKGVFAEAVMGSCNSCERIEEDRFWRWDQAPIPNSPTSIDPIKTPSPSVQSPNLTPNAFPSQMVSIQTGPDLPAPQGFNALAQLLSNPTLFKDLTGLTENQKNAIEALKQSFETAKLFGDKAADLTKIAAAAAFPSVAELSEAKKQNLIDGDTAKKIYTDGANQRSSNDSKAETLVKETETVEKAVSDSRITQQQATEILAMLKELREKESSSTLDKSEVKEIVKESTRFEHETPKGEKTTVTRAPRPKPRTIEFAVFILDTYGKPFSDQTIPATSVEMILSSAGRSVPVTLAASGTRFGATLDNIQPDGGVVEIHLLDESVNSGNIVFTGFGDINIAPDAKFVRISAAMDFTKQSVTNSSGETHEEQIVKKIDLALNGKLGASLSGTLAKVIEIGATREVGGSIGGGISDTDTDGTSSSSSVTFEARIPTENLVISIR